MMTPNELATLDCATMLRTIRAGIGRDLEIGEELRLAMLSGAYRGGAGIMCHDLEHPAREVTFPEYLNALGYRGKEGTT